MGKSVYRPAAGYFQEFISTETCLPTRFQGNLITEPLRSSGLFRIFIRCRLAVREPMDVRAAVVRADWLALDSMWVAPTSPPAEMVARLLKRAGKLIWRPERVLRATGGGGGAAGGATAGVASTGMLKSLFPHSVPSRM
jgi:hypothetical protein